MDVQAQHEEAMVAELRELTGYHNLQVRWGAEPERTARLIRLPMRVGRHRRAEGNSGRGQGGVHVRCWGHCCAQPAGLGVAAQPCCALLFPAGGDGWSSACNVSLKAYAHKMQWRRGQTNHAMQEKSKWELHSVGAKHGGWQRRCFIGGKIAPTYLE